MFANYLFDSLFLLIVIVTAVLTSRRLMVEAGLIFLAVLISSLIAIVFFEPIAGWCSRNMFLLADFQISKFLWFFSIIAIFVWVFLMLLSSFFRVLGEPPQIGRLSDSLGSWVFGGLAGYCLAAFLLVALQTLPVPRNYWGAFEPEVHRRSGPIMAFAPDRQLLAVIDYTCLSHSALTGSPWLLERPVAEYEYKKGRWASLPIRYALWREAVAIHESDWDDVTPDDDGQGDVTPDEEILDEEILDEDPLAAQSHN